MLAGCQKKETYDYSRKDNQGASVFLNYLGKSPTINGVINLLKLKNDSLDFVPRFVERYGMPVWDNSIYLEDSKYLLVPFRKPLEEEIEGVWLFGFLSNNKIHSFPVLKQKTDMNDRWVFDYFTCDVLKKRPKSGLVFDCPETKGYRSITRCTYPVIIVGNVEVKQEPHCWNEWIYIDDNRGFSSGDIPTCDHLDFGDDGGGGGSTPQPENKDKDKLPKEKPKTVVDDCDDNYKKIKDSNNSLLRTVKGIDSIRVGGNKKPSFNDYLIKIKLDPSHEHSMSIQNYSNDGLVAEPINTGTESSVMVVTTKYTCADIHNHPNDTPPSPRDLWVLVSNANDSNNYNTRFVIGNNGDYYAMTVTDQNKVKAFYEKYGSIDKYIDSNNNFIYGSKFQNDWKNAMEQFEDLGENNAWCYALAYIMQKYDMGIAMLSQKKDENGFTSMHMKHEVDPKDSKANYLTPAKCK